MVRGVVETINLFKTKPDVVVPLLQHFSVSTTERR